MISDQITILNETTLECINESNEIKIVINFTEVGLKVLGADFGFVWLNSSLHSELELVYKSSALPFIPNKPRKNGRNYSAIKNKKPDFVTETKKTLDAQYVSRHIKSFVIIPLVYKNAVYGSMVFCFKTPESFPKEKRILSHFIGNSVAQTITISRLIVSEREAQKKVLLSETFERQLKEEKAKIEFIANINHELRTPLAIIKGNIDLVTYDKSKNTKAPIVALRAIDHEVKHLAGIMGDLALITSKKEEVKNRIVYSEIKVPSLISGVIKRFAILARKKGISIKAEDIPDIQIRGDYVYLERMLANLVKNSIIYGSSGGHTTVTIRKTGNSLVLRVVDDGVGISKEDLPHIFERFYRADKSHNSDGNSTGLGLAIVKWVVEAHNGQVKVESSKKKGTAFIVTLPVQ